ncbi:unnamed protein product [Effrenium voratum]|nr:unnamed protein product [Effrenium voratum]
MARQSAYSKFLLLEEGAPLDGGLAQDLLRNAELRKPRGKHAKPSSFLFAQHVGMDNPDATSPSGWPEISGGKTLLLFGAGVAVAGGTAAFLMNMDSAPPQATDEPEAAAPEAPAEPAATAALDTTALLAHLGALRAELDALGETEEAAGRRAELQQEIASTEQQLEAANQELLAGRTLRQLAAAEQARRSELQTQSFLRMVYDKVAPSFMQMETIRRMLELRVTSVSTKVPALIKEEAEAATEEIKTMLGARLPETRFNLSEHLPPLTMLLAGLMAPVQLKVMWGDNIARLALSGLILSLDVIALVTSYGTRCISQQLPVLGTVDALHAWIAVDAVSLACACAVSAMVVQKCGATIAEVDAAQQLPEADASTDPEEIFRRALEKQLLAGSKAIIMYDSLSGSSVVRLLPAFALFDFVWQVPGLVLLFDTPGASCGARFLLDWARGRGIIFLIGLVPMLLTVVIAAVRLAVASDGFGQALLEAAASLDEAVFPQGPPIFTILIRSFVVRDVRDMAKVRLQVAKAEETKLASERDKMQSEKDSLEAQLAEAQAKLAAVSAEVLAQQEAMAQDPREAEFLRQYQDAVAQALALQQTAAGLTVAAEAGDLSAMAAGLQSAQEAIPTALAASFAAAEDFDAEGADMGGTGGSALD